MFQQHWCKAKSRWSQRVVGAGRCPRLYTGSSRARLVCLSQTGNFTSASGGSLAALTAPPEQHAPFPGFSFTSLMDIGTLPNENALREIPWCAKGRVFQNLGSGPTPVVHSQCWGALRVQMDLNSNPLLLPLWSSQKRGTASCTLDITLRAQSSSSSHWLCTHWTGATLAF